MSEAHERKSKRILSRDWSDLQASWIEHVPNLLEPGHPPQIQVVELTELSKQLKLIPKDQVVEVIEPIPGLRAAVLHNGIYLLHKAAHVLGSALVHVSAGMCTWSVSSAYQSAYFGMQAVTNLLGVAVAEHDNRHFLIDVWAAPQKPRKGVRGAITVLANTHRNEQRHQWAYLQRAVGMTDSLDSVCSPRLHDLLVQGAYTDFGRQRNHLHYRANAWLFNDLHQCAEQPEFGVSAQGDFDLTSFDFSLRLAYGLVRMARNMLADLSKLSQLLANELELVDGWLSKPFNRLYAQSTD